MARDVFPCHGCGRPTHLRLLDGRPGTPQARDESAEDYERLECRECYGEGWAPMCMADLDPGSEAQRATAAARGEA